MYASAWPKCFSAFNKIFFISVEGVSIDHQSFEIHFKRRQNCLLGKTLIPAAVKIEVRGISALSIPKLLVCMRKQMLFRKNNKQKPFSNKSKQKKVNVYAYNAKGHKHRQVRIKNGTLSA